jgi:hypothetical protein
VVLVAVIRRGKRPFLMIVPLLFELFALFFPAAAVPVRQAKRRRRGSIYRCTSACTLAERMLCKTYQLCQPDGGGGSDFCVPRAVGGEKDLGREDTQPTIT